MNERIKELAEQAADEIADLFNPGFFDDKMVNDVEKINKKFAELIVRECCSAIRLDDVFNGGKFQGTILKHFGIDQVDE